VKQQMNRLANSHSPGYLLALPLRRQQGLSLVELMISVVVGLILIAAVYNIYTGNIRSVRFTEGLQAMQENGRHGVSVLQKSLRLAGYSPLMGIAGEIEAFDFDNSDVNTLVVRAQQPYDCNGLDTTSTGGIAVNTYTLNAANRELTCRGNQASSSDMPIVEGVEQFRVLYGIDDDDDPSTCEPQRYVPFDNTLQSSQVVALRFAMLVNSGEPIRSRDVSESFMLLDQRYTSPSDRLVREVFSGTVLLRNNNSCTS